MHQQHLAPVECLVKKGESELIGQDLWKQLKRVTIPGDKRAYQNWKAAFMACVDKAPAPAECKLLQPRPSLERLLSQLRIWVIY